MKVLVTCPPMLRQIDRFATNFAHHGMEFYAPDVLQSLPEAELVELIPYYDGWIIGDDPATANVFEAGSSGRLKAAVKWGIGVDNVNFAAAERFGIRIANTPGLFGEEVADLALHYLIALARRTFEIDRGIRAGEWPKPVGRSIAGKTVALVGFGDIGRNFAKRALALGLHVIVYDPAISFDDVFPHVLKRWPDGIEQCHFLVLACALTPSSRKMVNRETLALMGSHVQLVNVSRGGLIDEPALIDALQADEIDSAALDVFDREPLSLDSPLRAFSRCILGSHNGSNTAEAVGRASHKAITVLAELLKV